MDYYLLDGRVARPCSFEEYIATATVNEGRDWRRVAESFVDGVRVSTVFLGLNHNRFNPAEPPEIFETMIFGGDHDERSWRCGTWDEAEVIHDGVVADLQHGRKPGEGDG